MHTVVPLKGDKNDLNRARHKTRVSKTATVKPNQPTCCLVSVYSYCLSLPRGCCVQPFTHHGFKKIEMELDLL